MLPLLLSLFCLRQVWYILPAFIDSYLKPLFLTDKPSSLDSMENPDKIVFGQPVTAEEDTSDREINQQLTRQYIERKSPLLSGI